MVREGLRLLEQREQEDQAKLEWLRAASRDATDSIERGEGIEFETVDDFSAYVHQMGKEVSREVAAKRKHG